MTALNATGEARALLAAARTRVPVAPLTDRDPGLSLAGAYAIQSELIALREAGGAARVGRKVGLTSLAMQEMLGVDQPDHGVLLDDMRVDAGAGLDAGTLIAPRSEPEIAFELRAPLRGADVTVDDVLAATSSVRAALEIIDSRVADWRITIADTIADNASSGLFVLGPEVAVVDVDLVAEGVTMRVGDAEVSGTGAAVLGHPAEAIAWLVRTLAPFGEGLEPGEVVLPGAMTRALPFAAGDVVEATFSTLGTLRVAVR